MFLKSNKRRCNNNKVNYLILQQMQVRKAYKLGNCIKKVLCLYKNSLITEFVHLTKQVALTRLSTKELKYCCLFNYCFNINNITPLKIVPLDKHSFSFDDKMLFDPVILLAQY